MGRPLGEDERTRRAERMLSALAHRGPDASGTFLSRDGRCTMVHARLSIIDLTPTGAQPMATPGGRFTLVFNGEIYNYLEIREGMERDGVEFVGTSDTEVLLTLLAREGPGCLRRLDGMFAFALRDEETGRLLLARDALGEKQLYFSRTEDGFAFASEVRALLASGFSAAKADWAGLGLFLRQGSIPAPWTHVEDVKSLEPGTWISWDPRTGRAETGTFWRASEALAGGSSDRVVSKSRAEAVEVVRGALRTSVSRRLRADVPVAAFLSGGLDSSVVVAMMKEQGASDLRTFTVVLPGHPADEAEAAEAIARHLGTRHEAVPLCEGAEDEWLDEAIGAMDVPSVDGLNTWLVSRAVARAGVKVVVSGLGGDELFYGYPSFSIVPRWTRLLSPFALVGGAWPTVRRSRILAMASRRWPREARVADAALSGGSLPATWLAKRGLFSEGALGNLLAPEVRQRAAEVDAIRRVEGLGMPEGLAPRKQVSFLETNVYLRDQLLKDSDVMSMAHALELRVPLISREVVEAVGSVPDEFLGAAAPKALLREAAGDLLPDWVARGPKKGFSLDWRTLLPRSRPWRSLECPFLEPVATKRAWDEWDAGPSGFAYPFALEVLARKVEGLG